MPTPSTTPDPAPVTAVAPAKINLHLAVGDLRPDGYHDLVTVYQALDLWEEVSVGFAPEGDDDEVTVSGPSAAEVPTDRTNLAARAVDLLRAEAGVSRPLSIHIVKGVPVAGGMAGGSADAAAALVAADRLLGLGLSRAELEERAAMLGSDIPFCVRGGTALGTGRGEELATLLHARTELHVVVATAVGGLSTPAVYRELDRLREAAGGGVGGDAAYGGAGNAAGDGDPGRARLGPVEPLVEALADGDPAVIAGLLGNDMEAAALSLKPELRKTLRAGEEAGALRGMVSGSGPTCIFLCADRAAAVSVAAEISVRGVAREVRVARGPVGGARILDDRLQEH